MAEWPGLPGPARPVRPPLPLPRMLLDALGYQGGARYVALRWWGGGGGDVLWSDGSTICDELEPPTSTARRIGSCAA
jgi:hypothetical protein